MAKHNPRRQNSARRDSVRARVRSRGEPCWICGLPIDYSLDYRNQSAYVADELVPVSKGGSPYDPGNIAAAHRCCNGWRKDRSVAFVKAVAQLTGCFGRWATPRQAVESLKAAELAMRDRGKATAKTRKRTNIKW